MPTPISETIDAALDTLQLGLCDAVLTSSSCQGHPLLLHVAHALLELAEAASSPSSDSRAAFIASSADADKAPHGSGLKVPDAAVEPVQQHSYLDQRLGSIGGNNSSCDGSIYSLSQGRSMSRRSSLKAAELSSHSHTRRRSVSFKADPQVAEAEQAAGASTPCRLSTKANKEDTTAPAAAAAGPALTAAAVDAVTTCSELVVELPTASAGLLADALSGPGPVTLELDLEWVLGGAAHKTHSTPQIAEGPAAATQLPGSPDTSCSTAQAITGQQHLSRHPGPGGVLVYARSPSGRMLRRSITDAAVPLSCSGKELWPQVRLLLRGQPMLGQLQVEPGVVGLQGCCRRQAAVW